jgi:hypothetical protein
MNWSDIEIIGNPNTYRIMAVMMVEADIITCPIRLAPILMIMFVENFKTDVIVIISNITIDIYFYTNNTIIYFFSFNKQIFYTAFLHQ